MNKDKILNPEDLKNYKKAILNKAQVEFLLEENGLFIRLCSDTLLYLILLVISCLCIWNCFQIKYVEDTILTPAYFIICLLISLVLLFNKARNVSVLIKKIKNLKTEFCYVECEVLEVEFYGKGKYRCFLKTLDGILIQNPFICTKEYEKGEKVFLYKTEAFKDKDRVCFLTKEFFWS